MSNVMDCDYGQTNLCYTSRIKYDPIFRTSAQKNGIYILNPNSNFADSHSGLCFFFICFFKADNVLFLGSIEPVDISWKHVLHVAYLSVISGGLKKFQTALLFRDLPEMMEKIHFESKNIQKGCKL